MCAVFIYYARHSQLAFVSVTDFHVIMLSKSHKAHVEKRFIRKLLSGFYSIFIQFV